MLGEVARTLVGPEGEQALAAAASHADPTSLSAATALRKDFAPELAAAALNQIALRRRARVKFGDAAGAMFFTPAGLEQATRPEVAKWRAQRLARAGVRRVVDLGCGIGADAMAFRDAGIAVRAVELDEATAVFAAANLGPEVPVTVGRAEDEPLADDEVAFCDPARRNERGRLWRAEDFTPGWDFVTALLERPAGACIKLGPALPHAMIPDTVRARWISHRGDVVEVALTSDGLAGPASRGALLLPSGFRVESDRSQPAVGELGAFVFEPDGAIIRSGAVGAIARDLGLWRIAPDIAYLTGDEPVESPAVTMFRVCDVLPYKEKVLRQWVESHDIGTLEIKKRGIEVDPAELRARLRPRGAHSATLILAPSPAGAYALVVERPRG